jgi:outer membrane protein TolC
MPSEEAIRSVTVRHPELKRLHLQMEQTQIDLRLSQNQVLPRFDFQFGASLDLGAQPTPTLSSAYALPYYPSELKIGVVLEIPLFLRTARGRVHSTQATYQRIEAQATLARDRIKTTLIDSLQAIEVSKKKVTLAREELALAKKLEEGEKVRFQHGDSNLFIVNLREQTTGDAATREVDALAEYHRSKADYQAASAQQPS